MGILRQFLKELLEEFLENPPPEGFLQELMRGIFEGSFWPNLGRILEKKLLNGSPKTFGNFVLKFSIETWAGIYKGVSGAIFEINSKRIPEGTTTEISEGTAPRTPEEILRTNS